MESNLAFVMLRCGVAAPWFRDCDLAIVCGLSYLLHHDFLKCAPWIWESER